MTDAADLVEHLAKALWNSYRERANRGFVYPPTWELMAEEQPERAETYREDARAVLAAMPTDVFFSGSDDLGCGWYHPSAY
jgi:hypothetical protein